MKHQNGWTRELSGDSQSISCQSFKKAQAATLLELIDELLKVFEHYLYFIFTFFLFHTTPKLFALVIKVGGNGVFQYFSQPFGKTKKGKLIQGDPLISAT